MEKLLKQTLYINYARFLLLDEIVDHVLSVLAEIGEHERDMHPIRSRLRVVLPDELVEWQVVLDVVEPPLALLDVATDTEVCGLPLQVLRVIHTAHGFVELLTSETAADGNRFAHRHAQGLQDVGSEIDEVDHLLHRGFVVDTEPLRRVAGVELFHCEVHRYGGVHNVSFSGSISCFCSGASHSDT